MSREDKADRNLQIIVDYGAGWDSNRDIAKRYGCSIRTIQLVVKAFKEQGYASLYSQPVVEADKLVNGKLTGVTTYTREPVNV